MMKQQYRLWVMGVVAILLVAAVVFSGRNSANAGQTLALEAPAFVQTSADAAPISDIGTFLSNEAGISAYIQTSAPIDLNLVRGEFRTIETETEDYIIGSVAVPDHPEEYDVHVYVHKDGWILAYYLNNEVTSKIVNVRAGAISTTKLETAISIIASAVGEAVTGLKFYDFRYPNATHVLIVAEDAANGRDFTITLPTEFGYFDRSFAVYNTNYDYDSLDFYIDNVKATRGWTGFNMTYGVIPASQLLPGQSHYIMLSNHNYPYGALVIVYRVP